MVLFRVQLQKLAPLYEAEQCQKITAQIIEFTQKAIIEKAYKDSPNKTYVPGQPQRAVFIHKNDKPFTLKLNLPCYPPNIHIPDFYCMINHLPEIIENLSELFPGVSFQIDPLKTYLFIDWS